MPAITGDRIPKDRLDQLLESIFSKHAIYFREYKGRRPKSDWNGKPIVGPPRRPFAELQMVERLERDGWTAGWCFKPGKFISTWEPTPTMVDFPPAALALLERIRAKAGVRAGCWDVFAWRNGEPLFVELKRSGSPDRIRASQLHWREAAESIGVPSSAFLVLEWLGGNVDGYSLKAMSRMQLEVEGWIRYENGKFEFGGDTADEVAGWLKDYRRRTGLKGADLLWVVFRVNCDGNSDWSIKQSPVRRRARRGKQH